MNPEQLIEEFRQRLGIIENKVDTIESVKLGTKEINLTSRVKLIKMFYNLQLKIYISNTLDYENIKDMDDKEVFAEVPMAGAPSVQGKQVMRKVTVGEQKKVYEIALGRIGKLLETMKRLLKAEGFEVEAEALTKEY